MSILRYHQLDQPPCSTTPGRPSMCLWRVNAGKWKQMVQKYSASRYIGPNVKGHHFAPVDPIRLKLWDPIDLISAFCVSKFQNRISYQKKVTAQTICPAVQNILKNLDDKFLFFCGGELLVTLHTLTLHILVTVHVEHLGQFFKIKFVLYLVPSSQKLR